MLSNFYSNLRLRGKQENAKFVRGNKARCKI